MYGNKERHNVLLEGKKGEKQRRRREQNESYTEFSLETRMARTLETSSSVHYPGSNIGPQLRFTRRKGVVVTGFDQEEKTLRRRNEPKVLCVDRKGEIRGNVPRKTKEIWNYTESKIGTYRKKEIATKFREPKFVGSKRQRRVKYIDRY